MTTPFGPVPNQAPVVRIPAQDESIQQTLAQLQALTTALGSPSQQGTLVNLLNQLINSGAQPFVPNVDSASVLEQPPGIWTMGAPKAPYRVWGGYVTGSFCGSSGFSGNAQIYGKVYVKQTMAQINAGGTGPPLIIAHIELGIGGASQSDSNTCAMQIPGVPIPANTPLILDINGNQAVAQAEIKMSGNIFFSVP